jgi:class 3 adenylate cyclase
MTNVWDKYRKPVPVLQWLVVIVLSAHVLVSGPSSLTSGQAQATVLALVGGNLLLLHGLPRIIPWSAFLAILVVIDSLLVPVILYATGIGDAGLYVVYFGIIMIAGAAGNLKRAVLLASVMCVAYGALEVGRLTLLHEEASEHLGTILLRVPFFLAMTAYYGAMGEMAQQERVARELQERKAKEIRRIFSNYVSPRIVEEMIKDPSKAVLGGQRKELTMLFADLFGFTSFTEEHSPEEVVAQLNEYLGAMTEVVFQWDGTLDKFVGDGIVVYWGAPLDQPDHVELAVKCALHMQKQLAELQEKWKAEGRAPFKAGIGIHTGEAVVGNIGAAGKKMDYTMIGGHVNLAARIQKLTREFGCSLVISEETAARLRDLIMKDDSDDNRGHVGHVSLRKLPPVKVKGKVQPVVVYALESLERGEISIVDA